MQGQRPTLSTMTMHGNESPGPVDVIGGNTPDATSNVRSPPYLRRWEMECTSRTDDDGRLVQRESYSNVDHDGTGAGGYTFDPRDVFQGEGGGIGGRGGGRGDGTTPADPADGTADPGRGEEVRTEYIKERAGRGADRAHALAAVKPRCR